MQRRIKNEIKKRIKKKWKEKLNEKWEKQAKFEAEGTTEYSELECRITDTHQFFFHLFPYHVFWLVESLEWNSQILWFLFIPFVDRYSKKNKMCFVS